ncbi:hypothetical protein PanWU01x14_166780 [Parasponia andersonii]|uniref:Uncharacterized protein n=1 Tax=Parasponia andersonii TaxID=3476 RepID=A0A2P5CBM8_PARAD|nr:hypothetical protein PanWU01x14_166780 [Parasponia andersonii]
MKVTQQSTLQLGGVANVHESENQRQKAKQLKRTSNFTPRYSLIRTSTGITSIKLLCSINEDGIVCTISHHIGIAYVMLGQTPSKYNYSCLSRTCMDSFTIHCPNICSNRKEKRALLFAYQAIKVLHVELTRKNKIKSQPCTRSTIRPGLRKEWKYNMSPKEPSVIPGQNTGMLFCKTSTKYIKLSLQSSVILF